MSHLLHIDSSIQGDRSISRALTARSAARWHAAHPGSSVTYRDLAVDPIPHMSPAGAEARFVPVDQHNEAQAASWALSEELIGEIADADTVLFGLPLYNFGPPSTVKAWVDHLIAPGLSIDAATGEGKLGDTEMIVLQARGGGYGEGTPREGWDHAQPWLPHGVALTGLEPRFITAELTLADVNPQMADLRDLAAASLKAAEASVDELWETSAVV
jgi:FMN-dependent NADH-azoreductase